MSTTSPRPDDRAAVTRWTIVGVLLLSLLVLGDVQRLGGNPLGLVQPGTQGSAAELFGRDFPDAELPQNDGLDGQITYAIARDPLPVDAPADALDRPRYRLQRPLLSYVAGALHPGRGLGLVWTLLLVNLAGVAAGAWATGSLSVRWGGPAWLATVFALLPGCFMAVRATTSDALAVGLALLAVALAERHHNVAAVGAGIAAVLAKEPSMLILVGWALAHRDRRGATLAIVPAAVAAAWMLYLRVLIPGEEVLGGDVGLPFVGLVSAARDLWLHGDERWGMVGTLGALVVGVLALWRGRLHHPLGWAVAVNLGFMVVAGSNPLGTSFGGTRIGLPLMALSIIVLATPDARRAQSSVPTPAPAIEAGVA